MNTRTKFIFLGLCLAVSGGFFPTRASAGWLDKVNQAAQQYNQANRQVQQLKGVGQQAQQLKKSTEDTTDHSAAKGSNTDSDRFAKTKTTNPITGEWGNQVTCAGPNSATCQNGMDNLVNCMHQTKGYYFRLIAAKLQSRLDTGTDLTEEDRTILAEDIASLNDAVKNETDQVVDPDPSYRSRYMAWLDDEDQAELQKLNGKYINEVRTDCDKRFGGMNF